MTSNNRAENSTKTVLICSACDHAAPIGDGWCLTRCEHSTDIECPNCGAVVISQPAFDPDGKRRAIAAC